MFSDFKKALPMSGLDLFPPRWIGDRARQLELVMRPHQPLPLAPSTLFRAGLQPAKLPDPPEAHVCVVGIISWLSNLLAYRFGK